MFRGPANVKFDPEKPKVEKVEVKKMPKAATFAGKGTTQVTFDEPGYYILYLAVNDASGVGGGNGFRAAGPMPT